jgi:hypothetical protein
MKYFDLYLADFYALKRGDEESMYVFNRRFYNVYHNMPLEIHPTETISTVFHVMAQYPDHVLLL